MFTGIVETTGVITAVSENNGNKTFWIESSISSQLTIDQSVNHNGVCLTVEEVSKNKHRVTAIEETLAKTNLGGWTISDLINLERSLKLDSRLDGHFVQGHIDATASCISTKEKNGSWEFEFEFSKKFAELIIEKGSVCLDGISLTVFDLKKKSFKVAIIPYTFEHTNIKNLNKRDLVNIELDMVGKYILRKIRLE